MGDGLPEKPAEPAAPSGSVVNDDAETQMRKALGLMGEPARPRPEPERMEASGRLGLGDRFNGGLHRRRFVQDGDVPVTVVRRDSGHDGAAHRGAPPPAGLPTSSRLQRTEAALAAETAARERAERSLAETQAIVRDLQTKIGHAELAKNEAIEALRREREATGELKAEAHNWETRLREAEEQVEEAERAAQSYQDEATEERALRKSAEKALRAAEHARDEAERLVRALSVEAPAQSRPAPVKVKPVEPQPPVVVVKKAKPVPVVEAEPEPVKWWLSTKPMAKRR